MVVEQIADSGPVFEPKLLRFGLICLAHLIPTLIGPFMLRLFIVYLHCIRIQRIYVRYDDLADCLHYIQLQFGVEPSEDSWRSKRDIFS